MENILRFIIRAFEIQQIQLLSGFLYAHELSAFSVDIFSAFLIVLLNFIQPWS